MGLQWCCTSGAQAHLGSRSGKDSAVLGCVSRKGRGNSRRVLAMVRLSRCPSPHDQTKPSRRWVETRLFGEKSVTLG